MEDDRKCPSDPLGFIRECVRSRRVYWTYHVNMRLKERFIPREMILESPDEYEIIEAYTKDRYLPSYLVYARHQGVPFHILFAAEWEGIMFALLRRIYRIPPIGMRI